MSAKRTTKTKRVALYLRVSTNEQTTNNQRRELKVTLCTQLSGPGRVICSRFVMDATVAPSRCVIAARSSARFQSAARNAVHVAAIAMAADQHLHPTALAQEQPRRRSIGLTAIAARMHASMLWTKAFPGAIMPLHSCSCTV